MTPNRTSVVVLGAGGHAKVVISTLQASGWTVAAAYDDDENKWGRTVLGVPVLGGIANMEEPERAVIALGSGSARERLAARFPRTEWITAVHPRAWVHDSVVLGAGTVIFAAAVVQPESTIGRHAIVNTGATVDHDCVIGDFVHLAPGCHLAGGVHVGRMAFLGIGSSVLPGRRIGDGAILGAGAVAIRDVENGATAVGVPARTLRRR